MAERTILVRGSGKVDIELHALLRLSETHESKVTSHPIESANFIADHVIHQNPRWEISAVISDATLRHAVDVTLEDRRPQPFFGLTNVFADGVVPDFVNQFGTFFKKEGQGPGVINQTDDTVKTQFASVETFENLEDLTAQEAKIELLSMKSTAEVFSISVPGEDIVEDLVLKQLVFQKDKDIKGGIRFTASLEQINIARELIREVLPEEEKPKAEESANIAATETDGGTASSFNFSITDLKNAIANVPGAL